MFICMPKVKFIIHFFLEILHFKKTLQFYWLTAFGPITGDPEFCQIWGWYWNINKNISFHFRLCPRKTNNKIFKNIQKVQFWGHVAILAFFTQIWAKLDFPGKKALSVFKYSSYLPSCQKLEKPNMLFFLSKMLNWRMDGQTENHDFVGPSVEWGSNYQSNFKLSWFYIKTPATSLFH